MSEYTKTFPVGLGDWVYRPNGRGGVSRWKVVYIGFDKNAVYYNLESEDGRSKMQTQLSRLGLSWFTEKKDAEKEGGKYEDRENSVRLLRCGYYRR